MDYHYSNVRCLCGEDENIFHTGHEITDTGRALVTFECQECEMTISYLLPDEHENFAVGAEVIGS